MVVIREWVNWLTVLSLLVMIFTLPFSKSSVEICFVIALTLWALKRLLFRKPYTYFAPSLKQILSYPNLPIYLFVLANFISIFRSASLALSLKGLFFKLLESVFLYFILAETINDRRKLNAVLVTMALSMLLIGADGIFQYMTTVGDFLRKYPQAGRITASFSSSNGFGGWLIIMLPLLFGIFYAGKNNKPKKAISVILWFLIGVLMICLAGVLITCLVLTRSRGA